MSNAKINVILQNAWTAWKAKHKEEAISIMHDALTRFPDWAEGYSQLGWYLDRDRQRSQAATAYEHALRLEPLNLEWTRHLGDLYVRLGATDRAIALYRDAIQLHQRTDDLAHDVLALHNHLASLLDDVGQTDAAIDEYRCVLSVDPDNRYASEGLAIVLIEIGQHDEALSRYQALLEADPQDSSIHWNYAIALDEAGLPDKAINEWKLTLDLMQDEVDVARSPLDQFTAKGFLGILLAKGGEIEAGVSLLHEAIASEPEEGLWHYAYGEILHRLGQEDHALAEWRVAAASQNIDYAERAQARLNQKLTLN